MRPSGVRKNAKWSCNMLLVAGLGLAIAALAEVTTGYAQAPAARSESSRGENAERKTEREVKESLQKFLDSFEISDHDLSEALDRAAAHMSDDFTAIFYIPKREHEVTTYNKNTMLEALRDAFTKYQGQQPMMRVSDVTVLVRSDGDAVASFTMNFYEKSVFRGDALAKADIRQEKGAWRIYRWYESKR